MAVVVGVFGLAGSAAAKTGHHHAPQAGTKRHTKAKTPKAAKPKAGTSPAALASVRQIPVTFSVLNNDESLLPCRTDDKRYTISGTLFLPAGAAPTGATLYAHGLGFSSDFWDFTAVPGYNYAGYEADHGHASIIIDRLGYGASGKPAGANSCLGGQATILHEIISDMRSGSYTVNAGTAPRFSRIGLVGHSVGGEIAEIEAYSFGDIQALGVMDFVDGDYSPVAYAAFGAESAQCLTGGVDQSPGGPGGYGSFGASAAAYNTEMFRSDADPAVVRAADAARTVDPCGDIPSVLSGATEDLTKIGSINVPIAFVWGKQDALFPAPVPWAAVQEALYTASPKVTNIELPDSGHAVTLGRSAPLLMRQMDAWLTANKL